MRAVCWFVLVWLMSSGSAFADKTYASPDAYEKCRKVAMTTGAMRDCGAAMLQSEEAALTEAWKKVYAIAERTTKTGLLKEQRAWITYKQQTCLIYGSWHEFGTLGGAVDYPVCQAKILRHRIEALESYYQTLTYDPSKDPAANPANDAPAKPK